MLTTQVSRRRGKIVLENQTAYYVIGTGGHVVRKKDQSGLDVDKFVAVESIKAQLTSIIFNALRPTR